MNAQQILKSTEVRRSNGQCEYGAWEPLSEKNWELQEAVVDEILEASCRDMRREPGNGNTEDEGQVEVGGQIYIYRR